MRADSDKKEAQERKLIVRDAVLRYVKEDVYRADSAQELKQNLAEGTAIFPAGEYQALRVDIGKAAGHNWWCAFYPNLCYTPEKNFTLSESGKKQWKKITELTQGKWLEKTKHYFTKLKKFLPYWAKRSV
ncbi:MAG: stage II sporulation protein R [Anaerobutyricum hallii]|uniref:stage II sporulation protein R n=1 Tax=Anaerobutyricum hallii TaxID=39488 RepID=UPI001D593C5A|nr:stage II sporulation protein R [Anaerobutyricum hallii]